MRAPKPGDEVRLLILDHNQNESELSKYFVYGRVHAITTDSITLDCWAHEDPANTKREGGDHIEFWTIMRPAILQTCVADWTEI